MIRDRCSSSSLWYCSVLDLQAQLLPSQKPVVQSIPLTKIKLWNRGGTPHLANSAHQPFFRLVVDSRGLRHIQRQEESLAGGSFPSEHFGYIVGSAESFSDVIADFAVGIPGQWSNADIADSVSSGWPVCELLEAFMSGIHLTHPLWNWGIAF